MNSTVFMVDDDPAVRDSLRFVVESAGYRVETFENAQKVLARANKPWAGCLVADLRLPGMSGLDLFEKLEEDGVGLPTIVITGHGDIDAAVRAFKGGAVDFLQKPFKDEVLLSRVAKALQLDAQQRRSSEQLDEVRRRQKLLTPREQEVMTAVVQGKPNKEIASDLGLSPKTIEVHRSHLMKKMSASSLADLVRMAVVLEEHPAAPA